MVLFHIITTTPVVTGLTRVGLQGSFILKLMFGFIVNLHLFRFFNRLKNGHLFDAQTIGNLNAAGKWWVVLWLFGILNYEIGYEILSSNAWAWGPGGLFAGLALIFFAWLFREAQELQEEQELTV
jgi:hypothetical protein